MGWYMCDRCNGLYWGRRDDDGLCKVCQRIVDGEKCAYCEYSRVDDANWEPLPDGLVFCEVTRRARKMTTPCRGGFVPMVGAYP